MKILSCKPNIQYNFSLGRLKQISYPNTDAVAYTYNDQGGIETVTLQPSGQAAQPIVSDMIYNAAGQIEFITYGNGVTTDYTYDPITLRLAELRTTNNEQADIQRLQYGFDAVGRIPEEDSAREFRGHKRQLWGTEGRGLRSLCPGFCGKPRFCVNFFDLSTPFFAQAKIAQGENAASLS